jgi:hypothetical protein
MNPIRPCRPDGFVQTNTDRCCACYSRSCFSLSLVHPAIHRFFRRALPAGETRSPRACVNILPFSYHQRIADADILTSHAQPSPPSPPDDDAKGVLYLHHPLHQRHRLATSIFFPQRPSGSTHGGTISCRLPWVAGRFPPACVFDLHLCVRVYTACLSGARCLTHWLICYCDTLIRYTSRGVAGHTFPSGLHLEI